jgi:hypothetical protein
MLSILRSNFLPGNALFKLENQLICASVYQQLYSFPYPPVLALNWDYNVMINDDFWRLLALLGELEPTTSRDKGHGNNCRNNKGGNSHGFGHSL